MTARRIIRKPHPTQPAIDAILSAPAYLYHGDKKYVRDTSVEFAELPKVDLSAIGYKRPDMKLDQLRRHYINDAEMERAVALLRSRKGKRLTSVGISLHGEPKCRDGVQGWCMESMVISVADDECHATVFYRVTEVVLKFAADLVFIGEVFQRLGVKPRTVRFHFSVAWIGMQFLPVLFVSSPPTSVLERLRCTDRTLWTSATWYLARYLSGRSVGFGPADRQGRFLLSSIGESRTDEIRDYLDEHGRRPKTGQRTLALAADQR